MSEGSRLQIVGNKRGISHGVASGRQIQPRTCKCGRGRIVMVEGL
jgi:hypothetical protein